jgi:hypothetical protein
MSRSVRKLGAAAARSVALASLCAWLAAFAAAQSNDPERPTPAVSNEIAGRIAPLDVGDSRRTRHFYAFSAQQGDLEMTVESVNLEGDVDLFTAASLRPLAKVTLFAGLGSPVTRTVFIRRAEPLVLRVQARTPNDSEGSYRIRLGGTFVAAAAPSTAEGEPAETAAAAPAPRTGRRVTSTGARIEEPRPEPTPAPEVAEAAPEATPEPAPPPASTRRTTGRGRANTREGARRGGARTTTGGGARDAERPREESAAREGTSAEPAAAPETRTTAEDAAPRADARNSRSRSARGRTGETARRGGQASSDAARTSADAAPGAETAAPAAPAPTGLELPGTRLVLELREGGRVEREMSEVRRVTVERGQIVVLLRSGRAERHPLSDVLRMSIEP